MLGNVSIRAVVAIFFPCYFYDKLQTPSSSNHMKGSWNDFD